jgi:hypothetical protein
VIADDFVSRALGHPLQAHRPTVLVNLHVERPLRHVREGGSSLGQRRDEPIFRQARASDIEQHRAFVHIGTYRDETPAGQRDDADVETLIRQRLHLQLPNGVPVRLGLQRNVSRGEPADLEAAVEFRSAKVPLQQAESVRNERQPLEPHAGDRISQLVRGLTADDKTGRQLNPPRHVPRTRERRRGPQVVRYDDGGALRTRQRDGDDAFLVRGLVAQVRRLRTMNACLLDQIEAGVGQRGVVRGHLEPEVGCRFERQFH